MSREKASTSLRAINILAGTVQIILAIYAVIYPSLALLFLMAILSVAILIASIIRIVNGASDKNMSNWLKVANIIFGIVLIVISLIIITAGFVDLMLSAQILLLLFSLSILIIALTRFLRGLEAKYYPTSFRAIIIIIGIITAIISITTMIYPTLDQTILIYLLSFVLIINGLTYIAIGIVGTKKSS